MFVPVVDSNQKPLMPTTPNRARRWVKSGKATPFWKKGVWCVRLNIEPSGRQTQDVVVGIDPGSKKEALTVASAAHCYLNIQADAVTWVGKVIKSRRQMRRARRSRKCPYRQLPWPNRVQPVPWPLTEASVTGAIRLGRIGGVGHDSADHGLSR